MIIINVNLSGPEEVTLCAHQTNVQPEESYLECVHHHQPAATNRHSNQSSVDHHHHTLSHFNKLPTKCHELPTLVSHPKTNICCDPACPSSLLDRRYPCPKTFWFLQSYCLHSPPARLSRVHLGPPCCSMYHRSMFFTSSPTSSRGSVGLMFIHVTCCMYVSLIVLTSPPSGR